ncbi:hypothetical protein GOP47_0018071 [Adiantum capillus-veneris]|uniref:Fe2OG dioxygenase domain-containing protein n=1 Tax=Adiantum capillus-veneris TaxID=13818 RepID=A0A9D4UGK8_ADICA|nr:hypothetical protein GOP47_0018071 [Adiantum capillus-veneris]
MGDVVSGECLADFQQGKLTLKDFEWEPHLRPIEAKAKLAGEDDGAGVPEVDIGPLYRSDKGSAEYAAMVNSLAEAASSCGFFQVLNHGLRVGALESLYTYGRRFFSLPLHLKYGTSKLSCHPTSGPSGYICGNSSSSPNKWWTEALRFPCQDKASVLSMAATFCPDDQEAQQFSDIMDECTLGFARLSQQLAVLLFQGLGLKGEDIVKEYVDDVGTPALKISHYPPCPEPTKILGLPPHSDVSILTLLWQDQVGGLQVRLNGDWVTIKPRQDALVVNIGDVFQVWSNDCYISGVHRATLNAREPRYSIGYFYYSGKESMLTPIPELLKQREESSKFRSTLLSEHRSYAYSKVGKGESKGVEYLKILGN